MDHGRRTQERAAAAGDPEAAAALLLARVRDGELEREGLELAAHLGEVAAALALGQAAPPPLELEPWLQALARWPVEVARRAVYALASLAEDRRPGGAPDPELDDMLRDYLRQALPEYRRQILRRQLERQTSSRWQQEATKAAASAGPERALRVQAAQRAYGLAQLLLGAGVQEEELRAAVRALLLPWALGGPDPLAP
ncbi:MAG: hypothetical protein AB7N76_33705 [Planctomycetota bacterium]